MKPDQLNDLLVQLWEHERQSVRVYETALQCVLNPSVRCEFKTFLEQTRQHERILGGVLACLKLDHEASSPTRDATRQLGVALVKVMQVALRDAGPEAAELIACECVVLAESKDRAGWELLARCGEQAAPSAQTLIADAVRQVTAEEDAQFFHAKAWCRELWLKSLGVSAVAPPRAERPSLRLGPIAAWAGQSGEGR